MRAFPNCVMLASAGSGKTHQLTRRFIELVAAGVDPSCVLSTTFTRKAAGEILTRSLREVARAATGDADPIRSCGVGSQALSQEQCQALASTLVRSLHTINVQTLDSFFMRIASCFALELSTSPAWRLVDEDEDNELYSEAVGRVLEQGDQGELTALLDHIHPESLPRSVHTAMLQHVRSIFDAYMQTEGDPEPWSVIGPMKRRLDDDALEQAIERLEKLEAPISPSSGEPNKNWVKAYIKEVSQLRRGDWLGFLSAGVAGKNVAGESSYSRVEITAEVNRIHLPLIGHASDFVLGELRRKNKALHNLASRFHTAYSQLKRERGVFTFADVPRMLLDAMKTLDRDDREHIYYRIDAHIQHLLLDEFQDTSLTQYELLEPMIEEIVAHADDEHTLLCVGDAKQSLYSWRQAEPKLLPGMKDRWPQLEARPLDRSYRSSAVILDCVNDVFTDLTGNAALAEAQDVAAPWSEQFHQHEAAKNLPGAARLLVAPGVEGASSSQEKLEAAIQFAAERIKRIKEDAPGATVGVLVRRRKMIPRLIDALAKLDVAASEEAGNPLSDAACVTAALSMLQFTQHPGDTASMHHVATSPLGAIVGLSCPATQEQAMRCSPESLKASMRLRRRLSSEGVAGLLRWALCQCAASMDQRGFQRFEQLIDLAQRFDASGRGSVADFVRLAEEQGVAEPSRQLVRVMTIHASKGLEFDAVVLPDLDMKWKLSPDQTLLVQEDLSQLPTLASRMASEHVRSLHPKLKDAYSWCLNRVRHEELCCLYVAMTRAVHALEMIVQSSDKAELPLSAAGVLRGALAGGQIAEAGAELWSRERGDWMQRVAKRSGEQASPETKQVKIAWREKELQSLDRSRWIHPSTLETAEVDLNDELRLASFAGRQRGSLLHEWFEQIRWLDEKAPDEKLLLDIARRNGFELDAERELKAFLAAIQGTRLGEALSRSAYRDRLASASEQGGTQRRLELFCEHSFAVRAADPVSDAPALLTGRFDRLVVCVEHDAQTDSDRACWAEIIDYKTDALPADDPEALAERVRHYAPQMQAYRRAAERMHQLDASQVNVKLLFTACDGVVEVGDS